MKSGNRHLPRLLRFPPSTATELSGMWLDETFQIGRKILQMNLGRCWNSFPRCRFLLIGILASGDFTQHCIE